MKRLTEIVQNCNFQDLMIDIGCDHGYLGIQFLKAQKADEIWNVEIQNQPLNVARNNFKKNHQVQNVKFFLSDGFINLPNINKNATIVLAGMGTKTILKILLNLPKKIEQLVFLTHTAGFLLRKWAKEKKYYVQYEGYVLENEIVYELIILTSQKNHFFYQNEKDLLFGLNFFYQQEQNYFNFKNYWQKQLIKYEKIPINYQKDWVKKNITLIKSLI